MCGISVGLSTKIITVSESGNEEEPKACAQLQKALCSSLRHCDSAKRGYKVHNKIDRYTREPFQISYMIVYSQGVAKGSRGTPNKARKLQRRQHI